MPLISAQISDSTLAVSSIAMGVAAFAICRALDLRPAVSAGAGALTALILYNLGILPVGLYIALGLAGIGSLWRMLTRGSETTPPVQVPTIALARATSAEPDRQTPGADVDVAAPQNPGVPPLAHVPARSGVSPFIVIVSTVLLGLALAALTGLFQQTKKVEPAAGVTPAPEPAPVENPQVLSKRYGVAQRLADAARFRAGSGGVPKNYANAMVIYQELAVDTEIEVGDRNRAAWALADMLFTGQGVEPSPQLSIKYYEGLVDRSAPGALPAYRLGLIYDQGLTVPRNPVRAYCYYNLAASAVPLASAEAESDTLPPDTQSRYPSSAGSVALIRREQLEKTLTAAQLGRAQDVATCRNTAKAP